MRIEDVIKGIKETREELRSPDAITAPVLLSENMYKLAQYVSAAEEIVADIESEMILFEAEKVKELSRNNWSDTKVNQKVRLESAANRATVARLNKLIDSSWRLINVSQSRRNHIAEELKNLL